MGRYGGNEKAKTKYFCEQWYYFPNGGKPVAKLRECLFLGKLFSSSSAVALASVVQGCA